MCHMISPCIYRWVSYYAVNITILATNTQRKMQTHWQYKEYGQSLGICFNASRTQYALDVLNSDHTRTYFSVYAVSSCPCLIRWFTLHGISLQHRHSDTLDIGPLAQILYLHCVVVVACGGIYVYPLLCGAWVNYVHHSGMEGCTGSSRMFNLPWLHTHTHTQTHHTTHT